MAAQHTVGHGGAFGVWLAVLFLLAWMAHEASATAVDEGDVAERQDDHRRIAEALIEKLNYGMREFRVPAHGRDGCGAAPLFPIGKPTVVTVPMPGMDRHFIVYVPTSYNVASQKRDGGGQHTDTASPAPLQILFHGLNGDCHTFSESVKMVSISEKSGYILASACGTKGLLGTGWNAGTCCGFTDWTPGSSKPLAPDDVGFAVKIVETVRQGVCIDERNVIAAGFSNGAMMSEVLGCYKPDVFRVVASVAGVTEIRPGRTAGLDACDGAILLPEQAGSPRRRPSVLKVCGMRDLLVPWNGNFFLGFPPQREDGDRWAERSDCAVTGRTTMNTTGYFNLIFDDCGASAKPHASAIRDAERASPTHDGWEGHVELVVNKEGTHDWFSDKEFDTSEYIYSFTRQVFATG